MEREYSIYSFWPCFTLYYIFRAFNLHEKPDLRYCLSAPRVDTVQAILKCIAGMVKLMHLSKCN